MSTSPWKGRRAESNNGWEGYGPWPYTILEEPDLTAQIERLAQVQTHGKTELLSFQPWPVPGKNQDRSLITTWTTSKGQWKVFCIFDGHAGHETVDYTLLNFLPVLHNTIVTAQDQLGSPLPPQKVISLLEEAIPAFDNDLTGRLLSLFPDGPESIAKMSDDEIRAIAIVNGELHPSIPPCLAGTTALVALLDPGRHLFVASLGDCQAVLGTKDDQGNWTSTVLGAFHNGMNPEEVAKLMSEHPGEPEVVTKDRVLGAIAVTRAIGDVAFKIHPAYDRVFKATCPSAHIVSKSDIYLPRCHTPPYLSNVPHVTHCDLSNCAEEDAVLIMASDGLLDLFDEHTKLTEKLADHWVKVATTCSDRPALALLREGLGGQDQAKVSFYITVEMDIPWQDDTTIMVTKL